MYGSETTAPPDSTTCSSPVSYTETMAGWFSEAADCASRRNRAWKVASRARSVRSSLIATTPAEAGVAAQVDLGHPTATEDVADLVAVAQHAGLVVHRIRPNHRHVVPDRSVSRVVVPTAVSPAAVSPATISPVVIPPGAGEVAAAVALGVGVAATVPEAVGSGVGVRPALGLGRGEAVGRGLRLGRVDGAGAGCCRRFVVVVVWVPLPRELEPVGDALVWRPVGPAGDGVITGFGVVLAPVGRSAATEAPTISASRRISSAASGRENSRAPPARAPACRQAPRQRPQGEGHRGR